MFKDLQFKRQLIKLSIKNGDDSKRTVEMDDTRRKPFPNLVIKLVQFLALGQSNTHNPKIVARAEGPLVSYIADFGSTSKSLRKIVTNV